MPATQLHGRYYGTGKRKTAIARVFLKHGTGKIKVNKREAEEYFPREVLQFIVKQPFGVIDQVDGYDIEVNVAGGGVAAQAYAIRHGISRALVHSNENLRTPLKRAGYLTRDARKKERKKPGQPGARKKFQYSKR